MVKLLLLLIALCAVAHGRTMLEQVGDPKNPAALCDPVSNSTIEPPANSFPVFWVEAEGTRNYTCKDGKVDKAWALAEVHGPEYGGHIYYYPNGTAAFDITDAATGELLGAIPLVAPPVTVPAPEPDTLAWARFQVQEVIGDLPFVSYVVWDSTEGGGTPTTCDAAPGEYVIVPARWNLTYYAGF